MTSVAVSDIGGRDDTEQPYRTRKNAVQQGRSERRGESYSLSYVVPLSEARTPLVDFVNSLLARQHHSRPTHQPNFLTTLSTVASWRGWTTSLIPGLRSFRPPLPLRRLVLGLSLTPEDIFCHICSKDLVWSVAQRVWF